MGLVIVTACMDRSPRADSGATTSSTRSRFANVLPSCPQNEIDTAGWIRVTTTDRRLSMRLPPGGTHYEPLAPGDGTSWSFPDGSISYATSEFDANAYAAKRADSSASNRGWCNASIDGRSALIEYNYAINAIGAAQFLQVLLPLDERRSLRLVGFWADTANAAVLLNVARSVLTYATLSDSSLTDTDGRGRARTSRHRLRVFLKAVGADTVMEVVLRGSWWRGSPILHRPGAMIAPRGARSRSTGEAGTPVHPALDELHPIHLAFQLAATPLLTRLTSHLDQCWEVPHYQPLRSCQRQAVK
jgi:hypothetical protein